MSLQRLPKSLTIIILDFLMVKYLGKVRGLLHDFNKILPPSVTPTQELKQRQTFFVLITLYWFPSKDSSICDQVMGSMTVSTLNFVWCLLCHASCPFTCIFLFGLIHSISLGSWILRLRSCHLSYLW